MFNFAEQITIMTEKELKDKNPWKEVAKMLNPNEEDCLFREESKEWYVCSDNKEPISCFEAEDMLSGWYWTKKFKELREASGIKEESDFYKRIALIEFHGYSSMNYHDWFGNQPTHLTSQDFNKELIQHIIETRKDVCFLVLRSWKTWGKLLDDLDKDFVENNIFINKNPRCQYITKKNLTTKEWNKVLEAVSRKPIN